MSHILPPYPHSWTFYLDDLSLPNRQILSFLDEGWSNTDLAHRPCLKKTDVISGKSTFFSPLALKQSLKYVIPHSGHQQMTGQKTNHSKAAVKDRSKLRYW